MEGAAIEVYARKVRQRRQPAGPSGWDYFGQGTFYQWAKQIIEVGYEQVG